MKDESRESRSEQLPTLNVEKLELYGVTCIEAATVLNSPGMIYNDVESLRTRLLEMQQYFQKMLRHLYGGAL